MPIVVHPDVGQFVFGGEMSDFMGEIGADPMGERIGNANVGFFLQTYAHVLRNDDRDAAERAAAFLIGDGQHPADEDDS
ncbi:Mycobacterium numidiamassiliense ORFan [Mycobacterium numidiamassiliense]|uniref:Mycobacterium numidiamassiliense ORFan n=1 Tax=Mycobacterium numidiamassiliense TaxID=1841861 RepID=A0A2U3P3D7_9MYCO|nr:hypothetical protein [Mycobacterium numidiamassiliense]SPM38247.1 Mycobacterium numidiamassiliense ORFan [Mycobacterium numidiamassiliense]